MNESNNENGIIMRRMKRGIEWWCIHAYIDESERRVNKNKRREKAKRVSAYFIDDERRRREKTEVSCERRNG